MNVVRRRLDREVVTASTARTATRAAPSLAETLEGIARALRSGASLPMACDECGLSEIADAAARGLPLVDAVERWSITAVGDGVPLVAAALALAAEIGGGAARSLDGVADTLRDRENVRREVRALSTQARASAAVIGLSPLGFALVVSAADPANAAFLVTSSFGFVCLVAGVTLNVVGALWIRHIVRRASDDRDAIGAQLADVVDLLALAVGAGLNLHLALGAVAPRAPPAWTGALRAVVELVDRGQPVSDALDALPSVLGERSRALARVLASADRYGTPLLPALERLAAEARLDRRRRAEEAARRVPVRLLFPLVLCALPAFGLLTVVPLLAGALDALRL